MFSQIPRFLSGLVVAVLLAACGGGSDTTTSATSEPSTLQVVTDNTVGSGALAAAGNTVTVNYTAWLYSATATNFEGLQVDSTASQGQSLQFVVGAGQVIAGFDQGVVGMRVGGVRTLIVPSALAYGTTGKGLVPPNTGLVFLVQLLSVQ